MHASAPTPENSATFSDFQTDLILTFYVQKPWPKNGIQDQRQPLSNDPEYDKFDWLSFAQSKTYLPLWWNSWRTWPMATAPLCKPTTKLVGQLNEPENVTKMILTAGTFQTVNILIWERGWREKVSRYHGACVRGMYMTCATWQGPTNFVILYISYRFICGHNAIVGSNVSWWGSMNHDKTCVQVTWLMFPH